MLRVTLKKLNELPTKAAVRPRQFAATPHQNDKDSIAYLKKLTIHHEDFRKPDDYSHTFPKDFQGNLGSPIKVNKPPRHDVEAIANQSDKLLDEKVSDYFNISSIIKMEDMVNAKMHFGHDSNRRHHAMNKYIFGSRYGMDIIDLDQSLPRFIGAMSVLAHSIYREGRVMLICENPKYWKLVNNLSVKCGFYNLNQYDFESLTHKLRWLNSHISGEKMPDVCIFLGVNNMNGLAQTELLDYCNRSYGLSIGFVDSDVNPTACTYRIPANDDSKESIEYYCKIIEEVYNVATQKKDEHDRASLKASLVNSLTDGGNETQSDKFNLIEADEAVEYIEKYESMGTMSADYGGKNMEMPNVPEAGKEEKPLTVKEKMKKRKIKIIKQKK